MSTIWANCPNCNDRNYYDPSWTNVHGWICAMCVNTDHAGRLRRNQAWKNRQAEEERKKREAEERERQERQRLVAAAESARREAQAIRQAAQKQMVEAKKSALRSEILQIENNLQDVQRELRRVEKTFEDKHREVELLLKQIAFEKSKLVDFSEETNDPRTKLVVMLGMMGEGKSTFGNRLYGDTTEEGNDPNSPFSTSGGGDPETSEISKFVTDSNLCVVDTPGLQDSFGKDREHVNNLVAWLRGCGGVNQFYLVKMSGNPRFHQMFKQMLTRLEACLGSQFWEFATIILTKVEGRDVGRFEDRSSDLSRRISVEYECNPPRVFGIGFDGYASAIERIANAIPNEKFCCASLKSPVEELEVEVEVLKSDACCAAEELRIVQQRHNNLVATRRDVEMALGNM